MSHHDSIDEHLSHISTQWTLVFRAHQASTEEMQSAKTALIQRYSGAIYRYLRKVLGQDDAADEVFQEFALQLVRGGFHRAHPDLGRFRDYVKVSVLRMVSRYRRRAADERQCGNQPLEAIADDPILAKDFDQSFNQSCCDELMARTWDRLRRFEQESGQSYYTVLSYRAQNPSASSQQAATELSKGGPDGRSLSADALRKLLQRARKKFGDLLLEEARLCTDGTPETVETLLIDLGLHVWCSDALKKQRSSGGQSR